MSEQAPLLEVRGLVKHYPVARSLGETLRRAPQRMVRAVDGVDLTIERGKTLALVGESGCGKTTAGRCVLYLQQPTAGTVTVEGEQIDPRDTAAAQLCTHVLQEGEAKPIA